MPSIEVIDKLEQLHQELIKLEPAIKHIETAQQVTQTVIQIPKLHLAFIEEVRANELRLKEELKKQFEDEVQLLSVETVSIQSAAQVVLESARKGQESAIELKDTIAAYFARIAAVNFPERLDRLDANVAGIMAAVQAVQSRMDTIERNLSDRIRDLSERHATTSQELKVNGNKQRMLIYSVLCISIISLVSMIVIRFI